MSINLLSKSTLAQMGEKPESSTIYSPGLTGKLGALVLASLACMVSTNAEAGKVLPAVVGIAAVEGAFGKDSYPDGMDPRCVGHVQPVSSAARAGGMVVGAGVMNQFGGGTGKDLLTIVGAGLGRSVPAAQVIQECQNYLRNNADAQNGGAEMVQMSNSGATKCVIYKLPSFYSVSEVGDSNCKAFISNVNTSPAFKALDSWAGDGNKSLPPSFAEVLSNNKQNLERTRQNLDREAQVFADFLERKSLDVTAGAIGASSSNQITAYSYQKAVQKYNEAFLQHKKATTDFFYAADRLAADGYAIKPIANQGTPVLDLIKTYPNIESQIGITPDMVYNLQVPIGDAVGYNQIATKNTSWNILKQVR